MEAKMIVLIFGLVVICITSPATSLGNAKGPNKRDAIAKFEQNCPPGLWCGKKRGLNEPGNNMKEKFSMIKSNDDCPPGIWCGKKRRRIQEDRLGSRLEFESPQNQEQNVQNINPQVEETDQNKPMEEFSGNLKESPIGEKLFRRFEDDCPPGLWCGKKRSLSDKLNRRSTNCPPGLWCGK